MKVVDYHEYAKEDEWNLSTTGYDVFKSPFELVKCKTID